MASPDRHLVFIDFVFASYYWQNQSMQSSTSFSAAPSASTWATTPLFGISASCAATSTLAPDNDLDQGNSLHGYTDQGYIIHTLDYLNIGTKGNHLA
jgi:hypothetical protein